MVKLWDSQKMDKLCVKNRVYHSHYPQFSPELIFRECLLPAPVPVQPKTVIPFEPPQERFSYEDFARRGIIHAKLILRYKFIGGTSRICLGYSFHFTLEADCRLQTINELKNAHVLQALHAFTVNTDNEQSVQLGDFVKHKKRLLSMLLYSECSFL